MGLIACHKDNNDPPVITVQPAGKVLLDTVMQPGTQLNATLGINATLIDLTNVY